MDFHKGIEIETGTLFLIKNSKFNSVIKTTAEHMVENQGTRSYGLPLAKQVLQK